MVHGWMHIAQIQEKEGQNRSGCGVGAKVRRLGGDRRTVMVHTAAVTRQIPIKGYEVFCADQGSTSCRAGASFALQQQNPTVLASLLLDLRKAYGL